MSRAIGYIGVLASGIFPAASFATSLRTGDWSLPESWFNAELVIEIRITDSCQLNPDIVIVQDFSSSIQPADVYAVLQDSNPFFEEVDDVPATAISAAYRQVFGQQGRPDRPLTETEYRLLEAKIENMGTWPKMLAISMGDESFSCHFDQIGQLRDVRSLGVSEPDDGADARRLSELAPVRRSFVRER